MQRSPALRGLNVDVRDRGEHLNQIHVSRFHGVDQRRFSAHGFLSVHLRKRDQNRRAFRGLALPTIRSFARDQQKRVSVFVDPLRRAPELDQRREDLRIGREGHRPAQQSAGFGLYSIFRENGRQFSPSRHGFQQLLIGFLHGFSRQSPPLLDGGLSGQV